MVRPNPRYGTLEDVFVDIDGYSRNLALEQKLEDESIQADDSIKNMGEFNPRSGYAAPSWWDRSSDYGFGFDTHQKALDYLKLSQRYYQAKINLFNYQCSNYPKDPVFCQHSTQYSGTLGKINSLIPIIEKRITGFQFPDISFPEILPQASAEEEQLTLSNQVTQIINDINNNVIQVPNWFRNNIDWVQTGHINEQEFLTAYNYLVEQQIAHTPITEEPITQALVNESISDNMITQKIDHFTIQNGRAIGQITFTATQNFNPFYYNKTIANIIQFKDRNGANILPTVKQNNLRFTATERDETIQYNEGMNDNIYSKVSSFVWSSVTTPTPFSKQSEFEIREAEPVKPISSGFMAAGVAGAIAGLILIGFIVDSKVGK